MDPISEARVIQKEIQEYKKEIISLERELKKNSFEEAFQSKLAIQGKLRQEMLAFNSELSQLKQEIQKVKSNQVEAEKSEAYELRQQIEQLKKENISLLAHDEQLKKSDQLLDINQQNYIYGLYQRRLGPIERENAELSKKIKKCEEDIENLKTKCEKVKQRYPSSCIEKLKSTQTIHSEVLSKENILKQEAFELESEIQRLKNTPKQNPADLIFQISEISSQIEKEKHKASLLEKKYKEKQQELRIAKLTIPKTNGSHSLYKEIELLSCILVDKMTELSDVVGEIEEYSSKINSV